MGRDKRIDKASMQRRALVLRHRLWAGSEEFYPDEDALVAAALPSSAELMSAHKKVFSV